jgi:hypothetical protein
MPPVSDESQREDANRKFLESYKAALLRSPAYNDKTRPEAIREMEWQLAQSPFDDIDRFMTPARAEYVRAANGKGIYLSGSGGGLFGGLGSELGKQPVDRRGPVARGCKDAGDCISVTSREQGNIAGAAGFKYGLLSSPKK